MKKVLDTSKRFEYYLVKLKEGAMRDLPDSHTTEEPAVYHNAEHDREEAIRRYGIGHVRIVEDLDRMTEACYGPRYRGQLR